MKLHVQEITIGGEVKRSDGNYGSNGRTAFIKLALYPGEDVHQAIAHGKRLVKEALRESTPAEVKP